MMILTPTTQGPEELNLDPEQGRVYQATGHCLQRPSPLASRDFLAPLPTVVSMATVVSPAVTSSPRPPAAAMAPASSWLPTPTPRSHSDPSIPIETTGPATEALLMAAAAARVAPASSLWHEAPVVTLVTPGRGHHELFRALEQLEGLEKEEQALVEISPWTLQLTRILLEGNDPTEDRTLSSSPLAEAATTATASSSLAAARLPQDPILPSSPSSLSPQTRYSTVPSYSITTSTQALQCLQELGRAVPRRVCQHPFKKNDIVWVCRTCQADETCVLCHACYSQSDHDGHDVAFYHAQAGGCCDCGDPDAWDPAGFCPHHGPQASSSSGDSASLPPQLVHRVRGVVPAVADWMVRTIAANAQMAFARAHTQGTEWDLAQQWLQQQQQQQQQASMGLASAPMPANTSTASLQRLMARSVLSAAALAPPPPREEAGNLNAQNMQIEADDPVEGPAPRIDNFAWTGEVDEHDDDDDDDDEFITWETDPSRYVRPLMFSPDAASTGRASSDRSAIEMWQNHKAEELGRIGAAGRGLYLVLRADDIHSTQQLLEALRQYLGSANFYSDTLLSKMARALRLYGELVVWGTMEVLAECGQTQLHLWMDGDKVACTRVGAIFLERASRLTQHGFFCSILTRDELMLEQRAVGVLQWLSAVARSCDPLCQTVAESILPNRHLVPLLRADFKMSARVTKAWYSLLLTLLAVPTFKSHLAAAYCDTYRSVTAKYARGMGVLERSGYTLSVQFLNRVTYVIDLVQGRDLLGKLGKSLLETLKVATRTPGMMGRLNPNHFVLTHRRYSPCVSDLKCVLNVKGMPRVIACSGGSFLGDWIAALSVAQFMDPQIWRHWAQSHVEDEIRGWVGAFNASISLGSLFERLLGWEDDDPSPIDNPASPLSKDLMTCVELTVHLLTLGVQPWQRSEGLNYQPTSFSSAIEPHKRCPASLPMATVAAKHGTPLAMKQISISQAHPFSFHIPLHRFVSSCIRELCLRKNDVQCGMVALFDRLRTSMSEEDIDKLFLGLMEYPVLVLTRAAQVRAGLWRRNGPGLNDQVLNYAEPPFCRNMRDADLLMVQFAVLGHSRRRGYSTQATFDVGMAYFSNLMLHRLGIFEFGGFAKAPCWDMSRYYEEAKAGLYELERRSQELPDEEASLPWTYPLARDATSSIVLLEEFLYFMVVFITELPPVVPQSRGDHVKQAKFRLFREVVHRLASGPKTHSELSEVHHVLSYWDNVLLSEEGKLLNPDDATGAALGTVLADVADRKSSRDRLEPDKWELRASAWETYDPAFFHISLRNHQTAAEGRPKPVQDSMETYGWQEKPYAPMPATAHPFFERLRRDATADSLILATAYRVLHVHCRRDNQRNLAELRGSLYYESGEKSETSLARALHIFTLGAYAWRDARADDVNWRQKGGGSIGSIFFNWNDQLTSPTAADWITLTLLAEPRDMLDCDWYEGEESALILLQRLASNGGVPGGFIAQDASVRSGAAWLCNFAATVSKKADKKGQPKPTLEPATDDIAKQEIERRKKLAKEKAMAKIKAQASRFASMMDVEMGDSEDEGSKVADSDKTLSTPNRPIRTPSFGSTFSSASSIMTNDSEGTGVPSSVASLSADSAIEGVNIPTRLLFARPRCIICNDEEVSEFRETTESEENISQRRKSLKRTENALGFVGFAQASTVLKGGGGPPPDVESPLSPVGEFVGTHVALCGHAVHSECCESYLATVSHKEDRAIGKRDEFRCPLCQRLSNCLLPFIDVGVDWVEEFNVSTVAGECDANTKSESQTGEMNVDRIDSCGRVWSLQGFLESTPWWVSRFGKTYVWDGQSAFVDRVATPTAEADWDGANSRKPARRIRSLKKKDLYAAWNAMMRTPRLVRRKLRPRSIGLRDERSSSLGSTGAGLDSPPLSLINAEESAGETIVWRRFMDQISDISYKADVKRLGDEHLHDMFGEFRHYVVEKYAYNMANRFAGNETMDWPSCMFNGNVSENRRQEMSREKLLSKLLLSIQSFTYSCCCEGFEARRAYKKCVSSNDVARVRPDASVDAILSRFGISGVECDGLLILMPRPVTRVDGGSQPFDGRLGKLRYFALAVMAAAGAVAADLVQLVLPFPLQAAVAESDGMDVDNPDRAPIAYPVLFGHILTHVVAAMCASCGRARALSDSLDVLWPTPFSNRGSFGFNDVPLGGKRPDSVVEDCQGFLKLGLLARVLQVMLGQLKVDPRGLQFVGATLSLLQDIVLNSSGRAKTAEDAWVVSCAKLLLLGFANYSGESAEGAMLADFSLDHYREACATASAAACSFMAEAGAIMQILVPGFVVQAESANEPSSSYNLFERLRHSLRLEAIDDMLSSVLLRDVLSEWYDAACRHARAMDGPSFAEADKVAELRSRLYRTQGFRVFDWPSAGCFDSSYLSKAKSSKDAVRSSPEEVFQNDLSIMDPAENIVSPGRHTSTAEIVRADASPSLVTFGSKKSVPLIGGFSPGMAHMKIGARPRVAVIPTSYTDLYAELGALMPDCEQTAVCLICGEVLNAGGQGECTRHSYKCGAGAGMFFLLQECSGLIMHKSKAAYIHSPYVDSHGETPQYRGRPLNLDLGRYEHLREVWFSHGVRQQVVAERGSSRQVILPEFY